MQEQIKKSQYLFKLFFIIVDTCFFQVFDKSGTYKFHFGNAGKEEGQLWYPRKVAVVRATGKFVVCDRGNERSRMQIFTKNGHFLKKIAVSFFLFFY